MSDPSADQPPQAGTAPAPGTFVHLTRDPASSNPDDPTLGTLTASGLADLQTLELPWNDNERGISCIPEGPYPLEMAFSSRFGKLMPHVLNVPGRDGILIHNGNFEEDTEGCILVGLLRTANGQSVTGSVAALRLFTVFIRAALESGPVTLLITRTT